MQECFISETNDGRYIVQVPNWQGGLYPAIGYDDDCRSLTRCYARIAEFMIDGGRIYDGPISIMFRRRDHPDNAFTRKD